MRKKNQAIILYCLACFNLIYFTLSVSFLGHSASYLLFHLTSFVALFYNTKVKISETYVISLANAAIGVVFVLINLILTSLIVVFTPFTGNVAIFGQILLFLVFLLVAYLNRQSL